VVAISIVSACLAIQNSASRVMFSMARDGRLPGARMLARVHPQTGTPIVTGIAVGALGIAVLLINLGNPAAFAAVTSTSVVIVYLAYLLVTVPALRARLRRRLPSKRPGGFSLGRWGLPVNLFAVVYGVAMIVNITWPRQAVYDPGGTSWVLQYLALLFVAGMVVVGLVVHRALRVRAASAALDVAVDAATAVAEA
jgi:amino acid transporter